MDGLETYRVVGVHDDGERVVIEEGMTLDRAFDVRELLFAANAFPNVVVEVYRIGAIEEAA